MPVAALAVALAREISNITGSLVESGMVDDQNVVAVSHLPRNEWAVAQPGADMSVALKKRPYAEIYEDLLISQNFALHMLDGALIQFSYSGAGRAISRHRLAYLPAPTLEPYQNDPELYFGENHFVDIVGHQVMPVPIRFDFDARPEVAQDVVHPVSHVTLGQYQHCRVPATRALTPSAFMNFILTSFYSTPEFRQTSFASPLALGAETITENERKQSHLVFS